MLAGNGATGPTRLMPLMDLKLTTITSTTRKLRLAIDLRASYLMQLSNSFGGVADNNTEAYLTSICSTCQVICFFFSRKVPILTTYCSADLTRVQDDAAIGNSPLIFGEWSLATQFASNDSWLGVWADAQKLAYSKGAGWIVSAAKIISFPHF